MGDFKIFTKNGFGQARIVPDGESFWIVGDDVLKALDYTESYNNSRIFLTVPEEWKGLHLVKDGGAAHQKLCLSELGLYFFLGRCDKPKALAYQMWIANEVVPTVRMAAKRVVGKSVDMTLTAVEKYQIWSHVLASCYAGNQLTLALDKLSIHITGESALHITETKLAAL